MAKQKKLRGLNGTLNESSFPHQKIEEALFYLEDMFDRAGIPFILLEGLAKQVFDNAPYFSLNQIDVGVEDKYLQETGMRMLKIVRPDIYRDQNSISFEHNGVPIIIWIIRKKWKFFQRPDSRFYATTHFQLPNPFKSYWKSRFLIK